MSQAEIVVGRMARAVLHESYAHHFSVKAMELLQAGPDHVLQPGEVKVERLKDSQPCSPAHSRGSASISNPKGSAARSDPSCLTLL